MFMSLFSIAAYVLVNILTCTQWGKDFITSNTLVWRDKLIYRLITMARVQGGAGGEGIEAPLDSKLMLLCVQAVTPKERPKFRKTRQEQKAAFNS